MSTAGRKAAAAAKLPAATMGGIRTPAAFAAPVRQPQAVAELAAAKRARFDIALKQYDATLKSQLASGVKRDVAERKAATALDEVAALVKQHALEAKDGDGTVLADVAAALMALDAPQRQMILRRAGNPEVFQVLENAELEASADAPASGLGDEVATAAAAASVKADDKAAKAATSRDQFQKSARPGQVMQQHGRVTKTGKTKKPSEIHKDHLMQDASPLDVDTSERRRVIETEGPEAAAAIPLTSTQKTALRALAGDQIQQVNAILHQQRADAGYSKELFAQLTPEQQRAVDISIRAGAYLPDAVRLKDRDVETRMISGLRRRPSDVLYVGTNQTRPQGKGSRSATHGGKGARGRQNLDRAAEASTRSPADKLLQMMYELTSPVADTDPSTGAVRMDGQGNPAAAAPRDTWINLNKYFPMWRARFGVPDAQGAMQYPANAPSALWLTKFMQATLNAHDPNFVPRMLPLIERSVERTPASTGRMLLEGGEVQKGRAVGNKRNAAYYDSEQFVPSASLKSAMEAGPGSADYPEPIYGDRVLDRAPMEPPALTPTPEGQPQTLDPQKTNEVLDAIEQMRQRLRQQPGNTDTSSIYSVPQNSPVRFLMA